MSRISLMTSLVMPFLRGVGRSRQATTSITLLLAGLLLVVTVSCDREKQAWQQAKDSDTLDSYTKFIEQYPDSELADKANARRDELRESAAWQSAQTDGSVPALLSFLEKWPHGTNAEKAKSHLVRAAVLTGDSSVPLYGFVHIASDLLSVEEEGSQTPRQLNIDEISQISMEWYYQTGFSSTMIRTDDGEPFEATVARVTAVPDSLEFVLRSGATLSVNPDTVQPQSLFLDTRIDDTPVRLELPLRKFTERLVTDDDRRRFTLSAQPIPTDLSTWRTTLESLRFVRGTEAAQPQEDARPVSND